MLVARDQRTRLNAELAAQYSGGNRKRGAVTPGRSSLTDDLAAKQDAPGELEEAEVAVEAEAELVAPERASKSLFDLPRKEPSRQPLLSGDAPTAPAASSKPLPPPKPSGPRRG